MSRARDTADGNLSPKQGFLGLPPVAGTSKPVGMQEGAVFYRETLDSLVQMVSDGTGGLKEVPVGSEGSNSGYFGFILIGNGGYGYDGGSGVGGAGGAGGVIIQETVLLDIDVTYKFTKNYSISSTYTRFRGIGTSQDWTALSGGNGAGLWSPPGGYHQAKSPGSGGSGGGSQQDAFGSNTYGTGAQPALNGAQGNAGSVNAGGGAVTAASGTTPGQGYTSIPTSFQKFLQNNAPASQFDFTTLDDFGFGGSSGAVRPGFGNGGSGSTGNSSSPNPGTEGAIYLLIPDALFAKITWNGYQPHAAPKLVTGNKYGYGLYFSNASGLSFKI